MLLEISGNGQYTYDPDKRELTSSLPFKLTKDDGSYKVRSVGPNTGVFNPMNILNGSIFGSSIVSSQINGMSIDVNDHGVFIDGKRYEPNEQASAPVEKGTKKEVLDKDILYVVLCGNAQLEGKFPSLVDVDVSGNAGFKCQHANYDSMDLVASENASIDMGSATVQTIKGNASGNAMIRNVAVIGQGRMRASGNASVDYNGPRKITHTETGRGDVTFHATRGTYTTIGLPAPPPYSEK